MKIYILFIFLTYFANRILAKTDNKEFCLHNYDGITKVVNPFYMNANNETVYFDTIEEYSKYIGPTWFGVSYCGNSTVVNNVGRYFTYVGDDKNKKPSDDYEVESNKISKDNNQSNEINKDNSNKSSKVKRYMNFVKRKNDNILNLETKEEFKNYYDNLYKKLMDPKEPLKCIPLNSVNPAYNPYHPLLIRTSNSNRANIINNMGTAYGGNTNNIMKNINNNASEKDGEVQQCGIVYNMKGSSISCSVRISNTIDESVSITDSNGKTYHQAYGVVYSDSNSYSDDINTILELSVSSTDSKSLSYSESDMVSNSSERVLTYTTSKGSSVTDSNENTHIETNEKAYAHTESEEHSHARSDGGEIVDETNWSKSEEVTHVDEYSRMDLNDYKNAKPKAEQLTESQSKQFSKRGGGLCVPCDVVDTVTNVVGTGANIYFQYEANEIAEEANDIAKTSNDIARNSTEAAYIANDIASEANSIAIGANEASWKANNLTLQSITSQETIAEEDRELQIKLNKLNSEQELSIALAGTRMTSDSHSTINTKGGSHSQSKNWSDTYTDTSGISNTWTTTNGYSDSYTKGHSETSTKESTRSDSISNLLTNSYTKDNGWSFESSSTNSESNSYSFGKSNTRSHSNDISMDESLEASVEKSYQKSISYANTKEQSQTLEFHIPDNGCYNLTAVPMFKSEVNIWACGDYDINGEFYVHYQKSIHPIEITGFAKTPLECNKKQTELVVIDNNYQNRNYISDNGKPKNTLISGQYLSKGNKIKSPNGKYYFGLLEDTGELALCKGNFNKESIVWSNGIDYLKDDKYDLKFTVNFNGHLVVTAKNIFAKYRILESDRKNDEEDKKANLEKRRNPLERVSSLLNKSTAKIKSTTTETTTTTTTSTIKSATTVTTTNTTTNTTTTTTTATTNDNNNSNNNNTTIITTTTTTTTTTTITTTIDTINTPINEQQVKMGNYRNNEEIIIWDSLPKDLPYNVGYSDNVGYSLVLIDDENSDYCTLTLYDGVGIKIWEIKPGQEDYIGYTFPKEYNMPLAFETKQPVGDISKYDFHNIIRPEVNNTYTHKMRFSCDTTMKENEALVSKNGKYKFYLQPSGNLVIKENTRTMWSSLTAEIEMFESPYTLSFSPIGELILRDKNKFIMWETVNADSFKNTAKIEETQEFYLILSDDGELYIEDNQHNMYWSSWPVRLYSQHIRYIYPTIYDITSCKEIIRNKYIYNLFSNPDIYNFYKDPKDPTSYVRKYYTSYLLPNESLISLYHATLNVTNTEVTFYYEHNNKMQSRILASCGKNSNIKELKLENNGLFLYCNDNTYKTIASLPENPKYYRLSIVKKHKMDYPDLMIYNTKTKEFLWGLKPVKFLNSVVPKKVKKGEYDRIITANNFTTFDRLISYNGGGNHIYFSNKHGLEFSDKAYKSFKSLSLLDDNFYINDELIIKDNKNMELSYDGINDKLIIGNETTDIIWELYGKKKCNSFISSDKNCNTIYSFNYFFNEYNKTTFYLSENWLFYKNKYNFIFNFKDYLKDLNEPVYSMTLNTNGDITLNNNKYILHKEYYIKDKFYELIMKGYNLILKSNTGEYKWALGNIFNRPYNASSLKIGDSFKEGEMLYCGDYSMIILNGKLLYRDHKSKRSTEIKYSPNKSGYLYEIEIGVNDINFKDKENNSLNHISSPNQSFNSKLYCDKNTRSIVWKINNTIKWRYPEISSNNGDLQDKKYILLCNKYYQKCLYAANRIGSNVRYADYSKTLKNFKWYFEIINKKSYLKSAINDDICLIVDNDKIITGKCSENIDKARISYNEPKNYIEYFNSSNKQYKCISGIDDRNNRNSPQYLTLANCNKKDEKMIWEIKTPN